MEPAPPRPKGSAPRAVRPTEQEKFWQPQPTSTKVQTPQLKPIPRQDALVVRNTTKSWKTSVRMSGLLVLPMDRQFSPQEVSECFSFCQLITYGAQRH